jgi:hypothetical protein
MAMVYGKQPAIIDRVLFIVNGYVKNVRKCFFAKEEDGISFERALELPIEDISTKCCELCKPAMDFEMFLHAVPSK